MKPMPEHTPLNPEAPAPLPLRPVGGHVPSPLPLLSMDELDADPLAEPEWLIQGLIPAGEEIFLIAEPGTGKTYLALDFALTVAGAFDSWHGRKTLHGGVLYIAGEKNKEVRKRIRAFRQSHGFTPSQFTLWDRPVILSDEAAVQDVLSGLRAARNMRPLVLVVVDTLSRCFEGDENEASAARAFMRGLQRLRDADDSVAALILAHPPKNVAGTKIKSPAGSRLFQGDSSSTLTVSMEKPKGKGGTPTLVVRQTKSSGGAPGEGFKLATEVVDLGNDKQALVIRHDTPPLPVQAKPEQAAAPTGEGEAASRRQQLQPPAAAKPAARQPKGVFTAGQLPIFHALAGLGQADLQSIQAATPGSASETAVRRMLKSAQQQGWVEEVSKGRKGSPAAYRMTDAGKAAAAEAEKGHPGEGRSRNARQNARQPLARIRE